MVRRMMLAAVVTAVLAPGLAFAADPPGGRYTMTPTTGGFLRLDTQTGQVSLCAQKDGQMLCTSLADERKALESEIDRLSQENTDLRKSVRRLEELAGIDQDPNKRAERIEPKIQLPSEEDVDKALTYVQRMLRKLKDKLKELEDHDPKKGTQL